MRASTLTRRDSTASRAARSPSRWACIEAALWDATSERRSSTPQPANGQVMVAKPHAASCAAAPSRESCAGQPASSATHLSPSSFTPKRQRTRNASMAAFTLHVRGSAAAARLRAMSLRQFGHLRCAAGLARTDATQARQKVCPHAGSDTGSESTSMHTAPTEPVGDRHDVHALGRTAAALADANSGHSSSLQLVYL